MLGTTLGHYHILQKLGEGGMGEVYAAEDTKLGRRVALKRLPADVAADPERLGRFQREARAVAALNHPNIVSIYSIEEAEGVQFLTLELVEGKTLDAVIPQGGFPLEDLLKLAVPLADAVAFAHEHGIVHRDLKPANIMVAEDGRLKVLDFGLAKLKPETPAAAATTVLASESLTARHTVMGTAAYMSPEQAEGKAVDHRTDVFSLGVVLYEMACGQRPFTGDTAFSVISSIIKDTPAPVSAVNRAAPPALARLITRALAKDPAARYQSALELCRGLREVQEQTASLRVVSSLVRAVARSRWTRRVAAPAVLVGLVAAAVLYLAPWRSRSERQTLTAVPPATFTRLTTASGIEQFPSLTPDGKWVVYAGQQSGNMDVYLLSTTGQIPRNLTADSPADDDQPAVSPDGERIAFRSSRDGGGIWVMGITGEGVKRVTPAGVSAAFNPAWSPDATEIAYATGNPQLTPLNLDPPSGLWIVNVATGAQRKLELGNAVQPSWSPHGHRVAYVAREQRAGSGDRAETRFLDIYTVPARGGEAVPVTRDQPTDWSPVWSPDGRYVYFASDRGGSMNLWRVAIDEVSGKTLAGPQQVTTPAPFLAHPSVSADGRLIAYCAKTETGNIQKIALDPSTATVRGEPTWVTSGSQAWANPDPTWDGQWLVAYTRDPPEGHLYVMLSDGTQQRQLTADSAIDRMPRWSPDKRWIAFFSSRGGPLAVWRIRFDGSDRLQVVGAHSVYPAWSPDGTRLAVEWAADSGGGGQRVTRVVDPNRAWQAQAPEDLPPPAGLPGFTVQDWSPDGTRLAGQIPMGTGAKGIVVYTFASRRYEQLTDFGEWPAWLPDSRRVLFVANAKDYWVVDTRTKQTRKIYTVPNGRLGPARLTRDGRSAYFSRRMTEADIYLLRFEGS